jgi:hypothetical protein
MKTNHVLVHEAWYAGKELEPVAPSIDTAGHRKSPPGIRPRSPEAADRCRPKDRRRRDRRPGPSPAEGGKDSPLPAASIARAIHAASKSPKPNWPRSKSSVTLSTASGTTPSNQTKNRIDAIISRQTLQPPSNTMMLIVYLGGNALHNADVNRFKDFWRD